MSTKAQAILDQIRALPPEDLRTVWQVVNTLVSSGPTPPLVVQTAHEQHQNVDRITPEEETRFFQALEEARCLWGCSAREMPEFE